MKSILKITAISAILSLTLTSLSAEDFSKLDVKKECDVKANGVEKLLETAEKYNKLAKENAIVDNKAKPTGEMVSLEFAAWRSCSFAISALTQMEDSKKNWKLASPSDGYKY